MAPRSTLQRGERKKRRIAYELHKREIGKEGSCAWVVPGIHRNCPFAFKLIIPGDRHHSLWHVCCTE